ncbi:hypothetical protein QFC20_003073 [Naganishia adeliensis]|uniref:Uncharacterized protein n=1 Tax=Naganishia adeliensis TaxID=92952 RepID=A0ACC2WFL2_9TREE|nr:hypothetical protein QFC20_003073 [Naganishia adeliensis]
MAFRTIIATLISFVTSAINVALLSAWRGHQHAWFCLLACSLDILINAIAIHWATKPGEWSRNAEGFDTSLLLITSRKSIDHQQEKNASPQRKANALVDPHLPVHDKDAYLRPQPSVYYPLGSGLAAYDDETWPNTLTGLPPEVNTQPPTIPEPILLQTPRLEQDRLLARCSTSDESGSSSRFHKAHARSVNELARASSDDREIGFFDFLGEPPGDSSDNRTDRPQEGQEEEGRFQKAFFRMLLGGGKASTSGAA